MMESKDGALLPLSSGFPPSAPRTGQVAFTTSGGPTPATLVFSHCTFALRSRQHSAVRWAFQCPECLDPFALCPALPDSLGGRHSTDYYGSAAPPVALATYPPTLFPGSQRRFRRCSHSTFSVSLRYPSVTLLTCEQAREAYPQR
jgi:hypothetical protein